MTNPDWKDPLQRFQESFTRASADAPFDHTAMTLITATPDGKPSGRIVLLKGFDGEGFLFFGNYESRKGQHLTENPYAALCFFWPWIGEQVRIEGVVGRVSAGQSDAYFATRPRGSQVGACASQQSRPLDSRETLIQRCAEIEEQYKGVTIPRPSNWGGWRLSPNLIEFWYNGEFRLHDRFMYTRTSGENDWTVTRLNP